MPFVDNGDKMPTKCKQRSSSRRRRSPYMFMFHIDEFHRKYHRITDEKWPKSVCSKRQMCRLLLSSILTHLLQRRTLGDVQNDEVKHQFIKDDEEENAELRYADSSSLSSSLESSELMHCMKGERLNEINQFLQLDDGTKESQTYNKYSHQHYHQLPHHYHQQQPQGRRKEEIQPMRQSSSYLHQMQRQQTPSDIEVRKKKRTQLYNRNSMIQLGEHNLDMGTKEERLSSNIQNDSLPNSNLSTATSLAHSPIERKVTEKSYTSILSSNALANSSKAIPTIDHHQNNKDKVYMYLHESTSSKNFHKFKRSNSYSSVDPSLISSSASSTTSTLSSLRSSSLSLLSLEKKFKKNPQNHKNGNSKIFKSKCKNEFVDLEKKSISLPRHFQRDFRTILFSNQDDLTNIYPENDHMIIPDGNHYYYVSKSRVHIYDPEMIRCLDSWLLATHENTFLNYHDMTIRAPSSTRTTTTTTTSHHPPNSYFSQQQQLRERLEQEKFEYFHKQQQNPKHQENYLLIPSTQIWHHHHRFHFNPKETISQFENNTSVSSATTNFPSSFETTIDSTRSRNVSSSVQLSEQNKSVIQEQINNENHPKKIEYVDRSNIVNLSTSTLFSPSLYEENVINMNEELMWQTSPDESKQVIDTIAKSILSTTSSSEFNVPTTISSTVVTSLSSFSLSTPLCVNTPSYQYCNEGELMKKIPDKKPFLVSSDLTQYSSPLAPITPSKLSNEECPILLNSNVPIATNPQITTITTTTNSKSLIAVPTSTTIMTISPEQTSLKSNISRPTKMSSNQKLPIETCSITSSGATKLIRDDMSSHQAGKRTNMTNIEMFQNDTPPFNVCIAATTIRSIDVPILVSNDHPSKQSYYFPSTTTMVSTHIQPIMATIRSNYSQAESSDQQQLDKPVKHVRLTSDEPISPYYPTHHHNPDKVILHEHFNTPLRRKYEEHQEQQFHKQNLIFDKERKSHQPYPSTKFHEQDKHANRRIKQPFDRRRHSSTESVFDVIHQKLLSGPTAYMQAIHDNRVDGIIDERRRKHQTPPHQYHYTQYQPPHHQPSEYAYSRNFNLNKIENDIDNADEYSSSLFDDDQMPELFRTINKFRNSHNDKISYQKKIDKYEIPPNFYRQPSPFRQTMHPDPYFQQQQQQQQQQQHQRQQYYESQRIHDQRLSNVPRNSYVHSQDKQTPNKKQDTSKHSRQVSSTHITPTRTRHRQRSRSTNKSNEYYRNHQKQIQFLRNNAMPLHYYPSYHPSLDPYPNNSNSGMYRSPHHMYHPSNVLVDDQYFPADMPLSGHYSYHLSPKVPQSTSKHGMSSIYPTPSSYQRYRTPKHQTNETSSKRSVHHHNPKQSSFDIHHQPENSCNATKSFNQMILSDEDSGDSNQLNKMSQTRHRSYERYRYPLDDIKRYPGGIAPNLRQKRHHQQRSVRFAALSSNRNKHEDEQNNLSLSNDSLQHMRQIHQNNFTKLPTQYPNVLANQQFHHDRSFSSPYEKDNCLPMNYEHINQQTIYPNQSNISNEIISDSREFQKAKIKYIFPITKDNMINPSEYMSAIEQEEENHKTNKDNSISTSTSTNNCKSIFSDNSTRSYANLPFTCQMYQQSLTTPKQDIITIQTSTPAISSTTVIDSSDKNRLISSSESSGIKGKIKEFASHSSTTLISTENNTSTISSVISNEEKEEKVKYSSDSKNPNRDLSAIKRKSFIKNQSNISVPKRLHESQIDGLMNYENDSTDLGALKRTNIMVQADRRISHGRDLTMFNEGHSMKKSISRFHEEQKDPYTMIANLRQASEIIFRSLKICAAKAFLVKLSKSLPSESPLDDKWPWHLTIYFHSSSVLLQEIFQAWRCAKYRQSLDRVTKQKLLEKLMAQELFQGIKATYLNSMQHPFKGDYVRLRHNVKWKRLVNGSPDAWVLFADLVEKIHRSSGKLALQLLVITSSSLLLLDHRTFSVRLRIPLPCISRLSLSPYPDHVLIIHLDRTVIADKSLDDSTKSMILEKSKAQNTSITTTSTTSGIISPSQQIFAYSQSSGMNTALQKGDLILSSDHEIEITTKLFLLVKALSGRIPELHISSHTIVEFNAIPLEVIFRPPRAYNETTQTVTLSKCVDEDDRNKTMKHIQRMQQQRPILLQSELSVNRKGNRIEIRPD
ncbi:hypothetical protein SNEBB_002386 [Seison nebaliae]|nr:hypothetical protein SNEBB_002386 [Seison nebaliae]